MTDEELEIIWREARVAKRDELVAGRTDEEIPVNEWIKIVSISNLAGLRAVRDAKDVDS